MDDREVIARALRGRTYGNLAAKIMADDVLAALEASGRVIVPVEAVELLARYRKETPPGHSPHMICHKADRVLAEITAAKEPTDG